jgi:hypothetical protein
MAEAVFRAAAYRNGLAVASTATTAEEAIDFIKAYSRDGFVLVQPWRRDNDDYVALVFDWYDCWYGHPPLLGRIVAPAGFVPSKPVA